MKNNVRQSVIRSWSSNNNVRFRWIADVGEGLLNTESGRSVKAFEQSAPGQ